MYLFINLALFALFSAWRYKEATIHGSACRWCPSIARQQHGQGICWPDANIQTYRQNLCSKWRHQWSNDLKELIPAVGFPTWTQSPYNVPWVASWWRDERRHGTPATWLRTRGCKSKWRSWRRGRIRSLEIKGCGSWWLEGLRAQGSW